MHFAYRPRKNSNPQLFRPRTSRLPTIRRTRLRTISLLLVSAIIGLWFLFRTKAPTPYREHVPSGKPAVVVLTVIDTAQYSASYLQTIKANREQYAARHGYEAMVVEATNYDTAGSPQSWSKIIAMRHALTLYPDCTFVWYLDQDAYIMDFTKSLDEQVTNPAKLESLMVKDWPVVPPDSIIRTFSHMRGSDASVIISQDDVGLVTSSVVIRNGDWAKFFVETWMDPLYRSYNFQKAERHALEHIVQWHPTILSKLALVPQRTIAAYGRNKEGNSYRDGDFVALMVDCTVVGVQSCEKQAQYYQQQLLAKYPPEA